jgi:hypothetical protein
MSEWVETTGEHLLYLTDHLQAQKIMGNESVEAVGSDPDFSPILSTHARTMLNAEGNPILVIGVWPLWSGVGTVWMLVTLEALQSHSIALIRGAHRFMRRIVQRDSLHRLQAYVFPEHAAGKRFAEHYGFAHEGTMMGFTQDRQNIQLYARTF